MIRLHLSMRALEFSAKEPGLKIFTDQSIGPRRIELHVPGAETLVVLFRQPDFEPGPIPAVVFVAGNVPTASSPVRRGVRGGGSQAGRMFWFM